MKRGNTVRRPKMSTNLLQLSLPSGPARAWSRTFNDPLRDIFFSLKGNRHYYTHKTISNNFIRLII